MDRTLEFDSITEVMHRPEMELIRHRVSSTPPPPLPRDPLRAFRRASDMALSVTDQDRRARNRAKANRRARR